MTREDAILRFNLRDIPAFVRLGALSYTWVLPIIGAVVAGEGLSLRLIIGILGLSIHFHIFAYVTNDVIDINVDRLVPRRKAKPLVRGAISPKLAIVIALIQLPLMVLYLAIFNTPKHTLLILTAGIGGMLLYNLYGKRLLFPLITDTVQGISWTCLLLVGAYFASSKPISPLMISICLFNVIYVIMINGIHGSLRDLPTDSIAGVRTTAIMLGAKQQSSRFIEISVPLKIYCLALQLLLSCTALFASSLANNGTFAFVLIIFLNGAGLGLLVHAAQGKVVDLYRVTALGAIHTVLSFWGGIAATLSVMTLLELALLISLYFVPLLLSSWFLRSFSGQLDLQTVAKPE